VVVELEYWNKASAGQFTPRIVELGINELMFDLDLHGGPPAQQLDYLADLAELRG
jgi:hypothetical protein